MKKNDRRTFLKLIGCSTIPATILGGTPFVGADVNRKKENRKAVNFIYDGLAFSPKQYLDKLNDIQKEKPIGPDFYGNGGVTKLLEEKFASLTGKEKAIYLPSGTMANQIAIKLLNGNNTKVMVPENSHVFRDEADAAQGVHNKRLIPLGKGKAHFDLNDLKEGIAYTLNNEVFKSGLGTVGNRKPNKTCQWKISTSQNDRRNCKLL